MDALMRRRIMMMESQQQVSYVDWLRSIGCIFYAPLLEDGDLEDKISGLSYVRTSYGDLSWVDGVGYKVKSANANNRYVAKVSNGITAASFPNDTFTTMYTAKRISTSGYMNAIPMSPVSTTEGNKTSLSGYMINGSSTTGNLANFPNDWITITKMASIDGTETYNNTNHLHSNTSPALPSTWSLTESGITIGMVRRADAGYYNKELYIKNIYIFDNIISQQQLTKIWNHDGVL